MQECNKPRILVIGCGSIGRRHIRLLKEMGVEVCGFDTDLDACHRVMNELGILPYRGDLGEVLKTRFDGAIIATPNHLHREPAEECLHAGLGVLIEKPMCHTLEEASGLEMLHNVRSHPVLIGYSLRFHAGYRRAKAMIDEGAIGTVRHANFYFGHDLRQWRPGTDYRKGYACKSETGGGVLLDASHEFDLCSWFFGQPRRVSAMVRNTGALSGMEAEDLADVLIDYGDVQVVVHVDYLSPRYRRGCVIVGDEATLTYTFPASTPRLDSKHVDLMPNLDASVATAAQEDDRVHPDDMYRSELEHFLRVIKGQESPVCTNADGLITLKVVEAARKSAETGKVVAL